MRLLNNFEIYYRSFRAKGIGKNGQMLYEASVKANINGTSRHETAEGDDIWEVFTIVLLKVFGLSSNFVQIAKKRIIIVDNKGSVFFQAYATLKTGDFQEIVGSGSSYDVNDAIFQAILNGLESKVKI